jgi:DNA-binding transcriptional LysR family regulator
MDLREVLVFTQVVRSGSFTAAAGELGMQKSSVSRKVADLEARLGVRLLQRTTRRLHLTDEGRVFYEHCTRAVAELEEAERALGGMRAKPTGLLRVTAPLSFGFLGPMLGPFLELHPAVQLEMVCTDRVVDIVEEGFDVAIRAGHLPDTSLIARRVGSLPRYLMASPAYLAQHAEPRRPEDLAAHACLCFGAGQPVWKLVTKGASIDVKVPARLVVNDYDLLRDATIAGAGIALLPEPTAIAAIRTGELQHVLQAWAAAETPIHALYPSSRHLAPKVKAFVDFLVARMRAKA